MRHLFRTRNVESKRNTYLLSKAQKYFLMASILTMIVQQVAVIADSIVVSHFISADAMSAVTLSMPLNMAIISLVSLLGLGATIVSAKLIGAREYEKVSQMLSMAVLSVVVVGLLVGVFSWFFQDKIISLICQEPRLYDLTKSYSSVILAFSICPMLSVLLNQMVAVDGAPEVSTKAIIVTAVINILLDILFVGVFEFGIAGSAYATVIAYGCGILVLLSYLLSNKCSIKIIFRLPLLLPYLKGNMIQGIPLLISNAVLMIMVFLMNILVQSALGADGMSVLAVCMNILSLAIMISNGFGNTAMTVGGHLHGDVDFPGMNILVKRCLEMIFWLSLAFTLVFEIAPSLFCSIFGITSPEMREMAIRGIRIFLFVLTPYCLSLTLARIYQMLGFIMLTPVVLLTFPIILIGSMIGWIKLAGPENLWYAFPESGWLMLLVTFIVSELVRKNKQEEKLQPLTLLPADVTDDTGIDYYESVAAEEKAIGIYVNEKQKLLSELPLDCDLKGKVIHCLEEVLLNIAQHGGKRMAKHYVDARILVKKDKLILTVKDDGAPFDVTQVKTENQRFGLKIMHSFCQNIEYKYIFGQNIIVLTWIITEKLN